MINSINQASLINGITPNVVNNTQNQAQYNPPQMVQNPNLNGTMALSAYNNPIKTVPKNIQPAPLVEISPEQINQIQGEKILSSTGHLDSIISQSEDGKTKIIYSMSYGTKEPNIDKIEYFDIETGNLIKKQSNYNDTDAGEKPNSKMSIIEEFDKNTKEKTKTTIYTPEKYSVTEYEKKPDGGKKLYRVDSSGKSMVYEETPNQPDKTTEFDKSGKIDKVIYIDREQDSIQTIQYKNGIPVNIKTEQNQAIVPPNKNPLEDKDLIPAEPFILGYDPKSVQGEKYYYSNGNIETIETKTDKGIIKHDFDIMGNLTSINMDETDKKHILFSNDRTCIEEELSDEVTKSTSYYNDGSVEVSVLNHKTRAEKVIIFDKDKKITGYYEHTPEKDENFAMNYNKQGQVTSIM